MSIDMTQFYQVFFEETSEHLATMETLLLALDVEQPALDDLNAIFRAAHSIKGGSGTFGFSDMTEVTHVLETLLDRLRKQELPLRAEMVDAFLAAGDVLRAQLAHHQGGPAVDAAEVAEVCGRLQRLADGDAAGDGPAAPAAGGTPIRQLRLHCVVPETVLATPRNVDHLLAALEELAAVRIEHRPAPGDGRLDLVMTTDQSDAALRDALAFYVDPEAIELTEDDGAAPTGQAEQDAAWGLFDEDPGYGFFDVPTPVDAVAEDYGLFAGAAGAPGPQGDDDGAADAGFGLFADAPGAPPAATSPAVDAPPPSLVATPVPAHGAMGRRLSDNPSVEVAPAGRRDTDKTVVAANTESSIRVSVEKVDQIINLVGELVITQAMLAEAAAGLDPARADRLLSGIELLARNTRDMQEAVMSIRMLPMSMVFSRFPRVVRDLAGKLGKQVDLRTVGENTELDKGLIEKIADPLTHLVRNSLDHGIETPEQRVAAGKPPKGTLTLKASHQGGNIVIEVIDDGAGLNRARLLDKARERGLPAHDGMSDHEVWQLIFAPGFSTAEQVTDLSGRGVGMDVVKRNIEGLGGRVELESSPGWGTRTVIRLPLTLAILDGMSVAVGEDTYILPITSVVESLQPNAADVRTLAGEARVVHIRGDYLPVISLAEVFGQETGIAPERGIVVVVEVDDGRAALLVDALLGQHQVVIKSLEDNYRKVPGVSGATIMGDGRVALILDVAAVARLGLERDRQHRLAA
jgi:two-component system chemotaxis sensor kinase CheA